MSAFQPLTQDNKEKQCTCGPHLSSKRRWVVTKWSSDVPVVYSWKNTDWINPWSGVNTGAQSLHGGRISKCPKKTSPGKVRQKSSRVDLEMSRLPGLSWCVLSASRAQFPWSVCRFQSGMLSARLFSVLCGRGVRSGGRAEVHAAAQT